MPEGAGGGSGSPMGVKPGALSALLQEIAATPEQREADPLPLVPGTVIGRFEIIRELGRGGFGVVYEARDRDLGRQVALKIVRPGRSTVEEGNVPREAEAISRLAHPNLITLFDVGHSDSGPYLVFELLRGKTLQERIDDRPLPDPRRTPSELEPLTILPRAWILNNRPADRVFWVLPRRSWSRWVAALAVVRPDPSPPGWYGPPAGGTSRATRAGRSL